MRDSLSLLEITRQKQGNPILGVNMDEWQQKRRLKRAEDYISNMISTMMSVSAVLATISVGVLAIVAKMNPGLAKSAIAGLIVISVIFFIWAFLEGRKSYGKLIWALSQVSVAGFDHARSPLLKCLRALKYGLFCLGSACFIFFLDMFIPFIKSTPATGIAKMINIKEVVRAVGYLFIIVGSIGMICFATKFPLSTRIKDLESSPERLLRYLNGYQVWVWSWILILAGSLIQLIMILVYL